MDLLELIQTAAGIVVLLGGGVWSFQKWRRRREHAPRLEFTVDVAFVGLHLDHWLVELVALVDNKGFVQHVIHEFRFDLRALHEGDPVEQGGPEINNQIIIPDKLLEGAWVPKSWEGTFIEPGLATRYSFVAAVPRSARFVLLHGRFDYGESSFHTADRLLAVPNTSAP